jgi:uncharacterized protein
MLSSFRRLALRRQGLLAPRHFGQGLSGARRAIEHLGYVQIDTISVVERAHHHVLWSRVPGYDRDHLNKLVSGKHIFEYWYHAASYLPLRDYRYALPQMESVRSGESRYYGHGNKRLMREILARVKAEGAMRLRDIDKGDKGGGSWWNFGPGRRAVESLFMQGDLMICERNGMEKVYDLAERCLPSNTDRSMPTVAEYAAYLFDTTARAHGVFTWKQLLHLKVGKPLREAMRKVLDQRIEAGVVKVLGGADGLTGYVDAAAFEPPSADPIVKILSPFDNLVIHRESLSSLFKFDYRIECYVAAPKRQFGYFCLPILYGDSLVARVDCKAHRGEQRLEVVSLHLEDGPLDEDQFFPALRQELKRFAEFNKCPTLDTHAIGQMHLPRPVRSAKPQPVLSL